MTQFIFQMILAILVAGSLGSGVGKALRDRDNSKFAIELITIVITLTLLIGAGAFSKLIAIPQ